MTNTSFLPQGYEVPASGNGGYMKFKEGINTFRVLSKPVIGYIGWLDDKTPIRIKMTGDFNGAQLREKPKHFWAFVVWNYQSGAIEILEISQTTIQKAIEALVNNPSWGAPFNYDITVTRAGASLDTTYTVQPSPPSEISAEINQGLLDTPVDLEALFINEDPFKAPAQQPQQQQQPIPAAPPMPGANKMPEYIPPYLDQNNTNY